MLLCFQDLQVVSAPETVQEDLEAAGVSSTESSEECQERLKQQRLQEEETQNAWRKREEEQRLKQEEEQRKRAEDELRLREVAEERFRKKVQEEAERRKEEEEKRIRVEKERRAWEEEENRRIKEEEVRRQRDDDERRRLEEQKKKEEEDRRMREEEEEARRKQDLEAARRRKLIEEEERMKMEEAQRLKELEQKKEAEGRMKKEEEEGARWSKQLDVISDAQEMRRRAEELRWKEMEERQRPFSFKVSSGEKQILFQKVNLSPVTPPAGHSGSAAEGREGAKAPSSEGPDSPNLPPSPYVPHTAILVTGAQLCGTAVHLDQIKDSACRSLLGVGEDRKAQGTPAAKTKTSPDRKSGKTKSLTEASFSSDQAGSAVLAEWASIRSKIFKGVEEGKYDEYPDPGKNQPQPGAADTPAFSHVNLRKTMVASAKFSITPAKKKFGDSNRNSEVFGADDSEVGEDAPPFESPTSASPASTRKPQNRTSRTVRIQERGPEECMFAKDLPSFLVPSHGTRSERVESKSRTASETEASDSGAEENAHGLDTEDSPSPFGIKLRRTNYSLRFHSEQSTEKRKKRYSAGDSFDGVPSPLTPIEPGADLPSAVSDKSPPTSPHGGGAAGKYPPASASPAVPRAKPGNLPSSVTHSDGEKSLSKSLLYNRPATSAKLVGALPTPPPSPLPEVAHGPSSDAAVQRSQQQQQQQQERPKEVEHPPRSSHGQVQLEEEPREKRSFFPSINIPWREKVDRKTELIRRGRGTPIEHMWHQSLISDRLFCAWLQKNLHSRADTRWTAPGSRRKTRRLGLCGSRWPCRSRRASGSNSRVEMSAAAKERPRWLKSKRETVYAHVPPNLLMRFRPPSHASSHLHRRSL